MSMPVYVSAEEFSQPAPIIPLRRTDEIVIGIQGGAGSFNEEAARHYIAEAGVEKARVVYLYTSEKVMEALMAGQIDRGQCAIYNSTGGFVDETVDALAKYDVQIAQRFAITIAHAMMIHPDADPAAIDTIMCHPQVLAQCKGNLARKYPHYQQTSGQGDLVDNAKVAEALGTGKLPLNVAVMGSRILAELYNLRVMDDNLQDLSENFTHFVHITRAGA